MIDEIDIFIMELINKMHNPILDEIMIFITKLGDVGFIWIVIAILLLIYKRRKDAVGLLIVLGITVAINELVLKNIFMRDRPFVNNEHLQSLIVEPSSSSFPSGHTTSSFVSAFYLKRINFLSIVSMILAVLIAFSRVYLNVHHPSDILAGILLAYVVNRVAWKCYDIYQQNNKGCS